MNYLTQTTAATDSADGNIEWDSTCTDISAITIMKYPVFLDPAITPVSSSHSVVTKPYTLTKLSLLDHAIQQQRQPPSTLPSTETTLTLQSPFEALCKKHGVTHHLHLHDIQRFFEARIREDKATQQLFLLQQTETYHQIERTEKTVQALSHSGATDSEQFQTMNQQLAELKQQLAVEESKLAALSPSNFYDAMFKASVEKINFYVRYSRRNPKRKIGYETVFSY
jgi:hypothetical protein